MEKSEIIAFLWISPLEGEIFIASTDLPFFEDKFRRYSLFLLVIINSQNP